MVDVPVLQVTIDDAQYEAFVERVKQFRADEAETPKAWGETAGHVDEIQKRFQEMAEALAAQTASSEKNKKNTKDAADSASTIGSAWGLMQVSARRFGGSVGGVTRDLAKWERAVTLFVGLTGAGSLYGLDKLAGAAAARRRRSSGAGVSSGQLASFETNFGRLGDTGALVEGFNRASIDVTARQPLQSLGVDARNKNAFRLFMEALPKVKERVDQIDPKFLGPTLGAYHLDQLGFTEDQLRLLRRMSREEVAKMLADARPDADRFDIPDDIGRKWQDLETQLTRAGNRIQTALADDLVNIVPGVTHVSEALVKLVDTMLSRPEFKTDLDRVGDGIKSFADWLGSDASQEKLKGVIEKFRMGRDDFDKLETWFTSHAWIVKDLGIAYAGYKAFSMGSKLGAFVRLAALAAPELNPGVAAAALSVYMAKHGFGTFNPKNFEDTPENQHKTQNLTDVPDNGSGDDDPQAGDPHAIHPAAAGRGNQNVPTYDAQHVSGDLSDRSKRELSGVNKPLAEDLVEAAKQSGIKFEVNQGRRTQDEANANAAKGIGVKDSQHLYGAAADIVMIDPATGQKSYDRSLYQKFYQSFRKIADAKHHENERWLGASGGRWGSDIVHFDQGIGYGQSHAADPYGRAAAPTAEDVAVSRQEVYKSPGNPFLTKAATPSVPSGRAGLASLGAHPNAKPPAAPAVHVTDNTGGSAQVEVHH